MESQTLRVAIQGDRASFHEIAALNYYKQPIEIIYCQTFDEAFRSLRNGESSRAFVAVRNSSHGEINEVKHLLAQHDYKSEGEYDLPIDQHLIGLPGTDLVRIQKVISHPVALSQCGNYLNTALSHAEQLDYYDTSAAVGYIKELSDASVVAIGSELAAKLHGLMILRRAIQDDPNNSTTFVSLTA
jgi:prephenate dehydratase